MIDALADAVPSRHDVWLAFAAVMAIDGVLVLWNRGNNLAAAALLGGAALASALVAELVRYLVCELAISGNSRLTAVALVALVGGGALVVMSGAMGAWSLLVRRPFASTRTAAGLLIFGIAPAFVLTLIALLVLLVLALIGF